MLLAACAVALTVGCADRGERVTGIPGLGYFQRVALDSIRLTYLCANRFRVRNYNDAAVDARWDVYRAGDSGRVTLPARSGGSAYSEVFFETRVRGTARLFVGSTLVQTKANGGTVCVATTEPTVPPNVPPPIDTAYLLVDPADPRRILYRRQYAVQFRAGSSGDTIAAQLTRWGATVVGGARDAGVHYIRVRDPGPSRAAVDSVLLALRASPHVAAARVLLLASPPIDPESRFPRDPVARTRFDWRDDGYRPLWPWHATRAPQAWGCLPERPSEATRVALLDAWAADHSELPATSRISWATNISAAPAVEGAALDALRQHASAIAGLVSARADNDTAVAGLTWGGPVTQYSFYSDRGRLVDPQTELELRVLPGVVAEPTDVLSISARFSVQTPDDISSTENTFRRMLERNPKLIIMVAASNDGRRMSANEAANDVSNAMRAALVRLRLGDAMLALRIVLVGGLQSADRFWTVGGGGASSWIDGHIGILAPAHEVRVLGIDPVKHPEHGAFIASTVDRSGTSFAAPMAAAAVALLRTNDEALSAPEVVRLLRSGYGYLGFSTGGGAAGEPARGLPAGENAPSLDLYGSLALLAAERPGQVPICGNEVESIGLSSGLFTGLRIHGVSSHFELNAPAGERWEGFSVAQGGRLVSVDVFPSGHATYRFANGQWTRLGAVTVTGYRHRVYLERDTAFVGDSTGAAVLPCSYATWPRVRVTRGGQTTAARVLFTDAYPMTVSAFVHDVALDPSGTWAAASIDFPLWDQCGGATTGQRGHTAVIARLAGGPTTALDRYLTSNSSYQEATPGRVPYRASLAWNDVGGGMVAALAVAAGINCDGPPGCNVPEFQATAVRTELLRYTTEGGGAPERLAETTIPDWQLDQLFWDPEGFRFRTLELTLFGTQCRVVVRPVRAPTTIAATLRSGTGSDGCGRLGRVSPEVLAEDWRRVGGRRALGADPRVRRPLIALRVSRFN